VARSIWKGNITFGMVSIPVRLFSATEDKDVSFHLLHQPDHARVQFKRWCSLEDREVPNDELVRAYEVSKDQYVELTDEDLDKLPLPSKHTIELSAFVEAADIDPIYFQKSYYLEPEETGLKPYALLVKVLAEKNVTGVAKIALRNKERLCALRPLDGTLILETLYYPDEIRERQVDLPNVLVNEREVAVASSLVDALAEPFQPEQYHDEYREAVLDLISSRAQGRGVVAAEGAPTTSGKVTDLMEALRASVEAARKRKPSAGDPAQAASGHAPGTSHDAKKGDAKKNEASASKRTPRKGRKKAA
jgi:DNA end-binding protein Ku